MTEPRDASEPPTQKPGGAGGAESTGPARPATPNAPTEIRPDLQTVAAQTERSGDEIGRYRLVQELGEGGFGVVYLADQREPVRRRVALKIIKLGMDTKQVIARFEQERQALAMMDHPNIAKVLDAGATATGRPYFVMELVRGAPITTYCDTKNLNAAERLRLFIDVCRAVQHAHQKGIIHRDLKPSNVLVATQDDRAVPKVIDFGIAKATNAELTERTIFTEFRQFIGTPEYMSPEQADTTVLDIDTRSDIYSLGVLLYELLTGTTPFDSERLRSAAFGEVQRIIREEEPQRPSTRISSLRTRGRTSTTTSQRAEEGEPQSSVGGKGPSASSTYMDPGSALEAGSSIDEIARHRRSDPDSLSRLVRGELDWIVMRCLDKDRARRYETASGLAADIERYLSHEPVLASPPSAMYRFRKLVQRRRGMFIAGGLVLMALVLGIIGTGWGLVWALNERNNAAEQATRAEAKANTAQRVSDFLVGLFEASDPHRAAGEEVTARMLLEEGQNQIAGLDAEPEAQATLRETIGYVYLVLSDFDNAAPLIEQAVTYREQHQEDELALARALHIQANLYLVRGDPDEAEPIIRRAIDIRKQLLGDSREVAMSMNTLGNTLWHLDRLDEAEQVFRDTLAIQRKVLEPDHEELGMPLHNLGGLRYFAGDLAEAEQFFREARDLAAHHHGTENIDYATSTHTISIVLMDRGHLEEALKLQREALAIRERVLGPVHWHVALSLTTLGNIQRKLRQFPNAVTALERGAEVGIQTLGPAHPEVWWMRRSLADGLVEVGRLDEAATVLNELIESIEAEDSAEDLALPLMNLAEIREQQGDLDAAAAYGEQAIALCMEHYGGRDDYTGQARAAMAGILRGQEKIAEAEVAYREAIDILTEAWGTDDMDRVAVVREYIDMLVAHNRMADAQPHAKALADLHRRLADSTDTTPRRLNDAAEYLLTCPIDSIRDPAAALKYSNASCKEAGGPNFVFLRTLARAQFESGSAGEAVRSLQSALDLISANHPDAAEMHRELSRYEAGIAAGEMESVTRQG